MAHTEEAEAGWSEFEANLVSIVNTRAMERERETLSKSHYQLQLRNSEGLGVGIGETSTQSVAHCSVLNASRIQAKQQPLDTHHVQRPQSFEGFSPNGLGLQDALRIKIWYMLRGGGVTNIPLLTAILEILGHPVEGAPGWGTR